MSQQDQKRRIQPLWLILAVFWIGLLCIIFLLRRQVHERKSEQDNLLATIDQNERDVELLAAEKSRLKPFRSSRSARSDELFAMCRWCRTRDDFASILSGSQIVSYSPISSIDQTWVYVPKGTYTLHFASQTFTTDSTKRLAQFFDADPSSLDSQKTDLTEESAVEIRIDKLERNIGRPLKITIRGSDDESTLVFDDKIYRRTWTSHENLKFGARRLPREIAKIADVISRDQTAAINEVIRRSFTLNPDDGYGEGKIGFRCWVQCDAPLCMSANTMAQNLHRFEISDGKVQFKDNMGKPIETFQDFRDDADRYEFVSDFFQQK